MSKSVRVVVLGAILMAVPLVRADVLDNAAVAALKDLRLLPHEDMWEYSGFIVKRQGAYVYTMFPHTDQQMDHVMFDVNAHLLPGDTLVGIYHNHVCLPHTHFPNVFSPADLFSAKAYDVPTFMLDNCTGAVHKFDWKRDHVHDAGEDVDVRKPDGTKGHVHLTPGRIVGYIGSSDPPLDTEYGL